MDTRRIIASICILWMGVHGQKFLSSCDGVVMDRDYVLHGHCKTRASDKEDTKKIVETKLALEDCVSHLGGYIEKGT